MVGGIGAGSGRGHSGDKEGWEGRMGSHSQASDTHVQTSASRTLWDFLLRRVHTHVRRAVYLEAVHHGVRKAYRKMLTPALTPGLNTLPTKSGPKGRSLYS